jgi:hypothetical protein
MAGSGIMTIREIHAAKHASKTGIEYFEARVEAQFEGFGAI